VRCCCSCCCCLMMIMIDALLLGCMQKRGDGHPGERAVYDACVLLIGCHRTPHGGKCCLELDAMRGREGGKEQEGDAGQDVPRSWGSRLASDSRATASTAAATKKDHVALRGVKRRGCPVVGVACGAGQAETLRVRWREDDARGEVDDAPQKTFAAGSRRQHKKLDCLSYGGGVRCISWPYRWTA